MEQVNVGFSREEMYRIALSIKELTDCNPGIKNPRFEQTNARYIKRFVYYSTT